MSILKVARMGHPVLRQRAQPVSPADITTPAFQKLVDDMFETMDAYEGIGLAAPQVHESVRLVLVGITEHRGDEEAKMRIVALINPEIRVIGTETGEDWEGCLSLPGLRGRVTRPNEIKVSALDRDGGRFELHLEGYPARVTQHETDHLDGILFVDRMTSFETLTFLEEYARFWAKD